MLPAIMVLLDNGGRRGGEVAIAAVPRDLADLVEQTSIDADRPATDDWRIVPDPSPHLIAIVGTSGGTPRLSIVVVGARSRFEAIDTSGRIATIAVRLRPGALPVITGVAAREFVDRSVPLGNVFAGGLLRDLQLSADAPPPLIAEELLRLLRRARRGEVSTPMPAVGPGTRVTDLASCLGMPTRTLHQRFLHDVGVSPKRVLRVVRLHTALSLARGCGSWSEVALAAGFADQSHLTREMKALVGETPIAWASRGSADSFKTRMSAPL